jgi:hypothetical protein
VMPAVLVLAMAGLFAALVSLGNTGAMRVHERPRPTPEMMAPRPPPTDSGRVSFGMIDAHQVQGGW